MSINPLVSIVIPAYNEEARLSETLQEVMAYFGGQGFAHEVIVVDDGSQDATGAIVKKELERYPDLHLVQVPHGGKGHACRNGVLASQGQWIFLCDADLSMPIQEFAKFSVEFERQTPILVGSREALGARRINEPEYRHVMGRVFNFLVRLLAVRGLQDTQCGFKCFRADAARKLFQLQTIPGWSFDVEILYIAQKLGYSIKEIPIDWYYRSQSKVKPVRDTLNMLRELLKIRWNDIQGRYPNKT